MSDTEFRQRLAETKFVVKASSDEMQLLWEKFCKQSMYKTELTKYDWEQLNPGRVLTLGELAGMPVCVSVFWFKINGIMVMFIEGTSQVVDHRMIDKWLEENCAPRWDGGSRPAECNTVNFHHVLNYIDRPEDQ